MHFKQKKYVLCVAFISGTMKEFDLNGVARSPSFPHSRVSEIQGAKKLNSSLLCL